MERKRITPRVFRDDGWPEARDYDDNYYPLTEEWRLPECCQQHLPVVPHRVRPDINDRPPRDAAADRAARPGS